MVLKLVLKSEKDSKVCTWWGEQGGSGISRGRAGVRDVAEQTGPSGWSVRCVEGGRDGERHMCLTRLQWVSPSPGKVTAPVPQISTDELPAEPGYPCTQHTARPGVLRRPMRVLLLLACSLCSREL